MDERRIKAVVLLQAKKVQSMLESVRAIQSRVQVPIAYAVDMLMSQIRSIQSVQLSPHSQRWYQRIMIESLSQDLQIKKVRNRYVCSNARADAMDFKIWYSRERKLDYGGLNPSSLDIYVDRVMKRDYS